MRGYEDWNSFARSLGYEDEYAMLYDLYVVEGASVISIATRFGCGEATINRHMRQKGIDRRARGGAMNTARLRKKLFRMDQRFVLSTNDDDLAKLIDCSPSLSYKYKRALKGGKLELLCDQSDSGSGPVQPTF